MSEDDTFTALARISYEELLSLLNLSSVSSWHSWTSIINSNHWTVSDYLRAHHPTMSKTEIDKFIANIKTILDRNHIKYV